MVLSRCFRCSEATFHVWHDIRTLYHLKMYLRPRASRRADKPGAPPKAAERAGNHAFRRSDT
jgi:hypothetical protein